MNLAEIFFAVFTAILVLVFIPIDIIIVCNAYKKHTHKLKQSNSSFVRDTVEDFNSPQINEFSLDCSESFALNQLLSSDNYNRYYSLVKQISQDNYYNIGPGVQRGSVRLSENRYIDDNDYRTILDNVVRKSSILPQQEKSDIMRLLSHSQLD